MRKGNSILIIVTMASSHPSSSASSFAAMTSRTTRTLVHALQLDLLALVDASATHHLLLGYLPYFLPVMVSDKGRAVDEDGDGDGWRRRILPLYYRGWSMTMIMMAMTTVTPLTCECEDEQKGQQGQQRQTCNARMVRFGIGTDADHPCQ